MKPDSLWWMRQSKDELYEHIKDIKTHEWFEKEIARRKKDCEELFDEDTLALLIVDGLGRNTQGITPIASLEAKNEYTIVGTVRNILPQKTFSKKNGMEGRVVNLDVADDSGICRVVLWNNDVDVIKNKHIKQGSTIKIINGYTKQGYSGIELNVGRWGLVEVVDDQEIKKPVGQPSTQPGDVQGKIVKIQPTRAFFRDDGEFGFVTTITVQQDTQKPEDFILWGSKVKEIQEYSMGDMIHITNIMTRFVQGKKEFHVNEQSRLYRC